MKILCVKCDEEIANKVGQYRNFTGKIDWQGTKGEVINADFELDYVAGIIFDKGTWKNGVWKKGYWNAGTWENGVWEDGEHLAGIWKGGTWKKGFWKNGKGKPENA